MSARNRVVFTTSAKAQPAASSTAVRFRRARSAWASTPPSTRLPVAGSRPIWPEQKTRPRAVIPWLYGPIAAGAPAVETARPVMTPSSCCRHDRRRLDPRRPVARDGERSFEDGSVELAGGGLGGRDRRIERPQGRTGARLPDRP